MMPTSVATCVGVVEEKEKMRGIERGEVEGMRAHFEKFTIEPLSVPSHHMKVTP